MIPFLEACGAPRPLRLAVECPGKAEVWHSRFDSPFVLIGRAATADLHLPHPEVGERHLYLQIVAGRLFFVDLGSRTGTFLEGRRLRSGWVEGREIRIGPYRLRLLEEDGEAGGRPDEAMPARLDLELRHRAIRSSRCSTDEGLTLVGSATGCQVRLLDPIVSNYHCSLVQTPIGVWVVDLLGRGGVAVNGVPVRHGLLHEGDELRVGQSAIRLLPGPSGDVGGVPVASPGGIQTASAIVPVHSLTPGVPSLPAAFSDLKSLLAGQPADRVELVESLLVPLVNQFGLMQQQMFEQFRQSESNLLRAFTDSQQDQLGTIQEEIDRLRELTQEVDQLRSELASQVQSSSGRGRSAETTVGPVRLGRATRVAAQSEPVAAGPPALAPSDVLPAVEEGPEDPTGEDESGATQGEPRSRWQKALGMVSGPRRKATI